jgi:hypothetical protein
MRPDVCVFMGATLVDIKQLPGASAQQLKKAQKPM